MLIFPSWLMHGAESNHGGEDRVSIHFNIGMLPT
jgi:ectoine hydroxylase-related dioxygenase (phytanoyl-CoA dioxygenase family)